MTEDKIVVIGWQPLSRRSSSFCKASGARLFLIHYFAFKKPLVAPVKYILQAIKTLSVLIRERPAYVFVENPPVVLPLTAFIYTRLTFSQLVIDSATGVFVEPKWKVFNFLFRYLARRACINIVTNDGWRAVVEGWGARAMTLEDRVPDMPETAPVRLKEGSNIVVINTFSVDEPIEELLSAASRLGNVNFYITGSMTHAKREHLEAAPPNVIFTGYLEEPWPYFSYLRQADAIVVLTSTDNTLCAGMYEAVAANRPLVASDWPVVRGLFSKGTIYVSNTGDGIAKGVELALKDRERLGVEMAELGMEMREGWAKRHAALMDSLKTGKGRTFVR